MDGTAEKDLSIPSIKLESPEDESNGEIETSNKMDDARGYSDETKDTNDNQKNVDILPIPPIRHQSKALLEMDSKHSWLDEADHRCANLETAFISKIQYVALSNHFQEYLEHLQAKKEDVPDVYGEFANLFEKFRTCFVGSQRLQNKVFELNAEKAMVNSQIRKLKIKLYETENKLKELTDRLDSMSQSAIQSDKEKIALQRQIIELKEEMSRLRQDRKYFPEDEDKGTSEEKKEQQLKIKQLEKEVSILREDLESSKKLQDIYHSKLMEADEAQSSLQNDLTIAKSELQKKVTSLDKAHEQMAEYTTQFNSQMEKTKELFGEINRLKSEVKEMKIKYKRVLADLKKCQKESEGKRKTIDKFRKDLDIREDRVSLLTAQKEALEIERSHKQSEINSLKVDNAAITKQRNEYFRKIDLLESKISDLESKIETLKEENRSQKKTLEAMEKVSDEFDDKIKELTRERDGYLDELQKRMLVLVEQRQDFKLTQEREIILKKNLDACNRTIESLQNTVKRQEKEQERFSAHARNLNKTIEDLQNEIKRMELQLTESQKIAGRFEQQLNDERMKCKSMAEDVRFYRKSCSDAKHVTKQAEGKLEILNKHVLQLRSYNQNLDEKRKELISQNQNIVEQLGTAKESLKQEKKHGENLVSELKHKDDEENVYFKKMLDSEQKIDTLRRKLENSITEKDALISKIHKKDGVVCDLKEKIKLLESDLAKMDRILCERVDDVKLLKAQLCQMNRSQALLEGQVEYMCATRQELTNVQEELQEEKLKRKGMEEEIQRTINFHRWRILEGTDPDRAHLVAKSLELQKQLVKKTADLGAKEEELQQKGLEIEKLKEQIQRRSESGIDNELWECKRELRARTDRLKYLTAENNMYESVVGKYKNEIMTLRGELKKYKMADLK